MRNDFNLGEKFFETSLFMQKGGKLQHFFDHYLKDEKPGFEEFKQQSQFIHFRKKDEWTRVENNGLSQLESPKNSRSFS